MLSRNLLRSTLLSLLALLFAAATPSFADSSHVRIIRLSLVQGDVRFARDLKGDPLVSQNATWEAAEPNLPIRQGYVVATDKGRAEVEFEDGSIVFLSGGTVLEFYDLSLEDGAKTTRLILRQGTASFYVNPGNGDFFSVTGGDFSVEADGDSSFRLDNFDDGSVVNVLKGRASVVRKNETNALVKGQSLSIRANDSASVSIGRLTDDDDFDRWVSGRIDSVATATVAAQQYVNSPNYSSGLAGLYTYGGFYPCGGYGNCWRPYGVGAGWTPFDNGSWFTDSIFGTAFIGDQPWGWLPYHYGSWLFDPMYGGWLWSPYGYGGGLSYGGLPGWAPVTGVWLRSKSGPVGIVPVHPLDVRGKAPINLARGVFPVTPGAISSSVPVVRGEEWKVVKSVPRGTLSTLNARVAVAPPERVSRTLVGGNPSAHIVTIDRNSSIAYDAREHRFVNTNSSPAQQAAAAGSAGSTQNPAGSQTMHVLSGQPLSAARSTASAAPARTSMPASRTMAPPPPPRSESGRATYSGGGVFQSSPRSSSASSSGGGQSAAPHASASSTGGRAH